MQQWGNQDFHLRDDHANGQKYPQNHLQGVEMTIFDLHKKLLPALKIIQCRLMKYFGMSCPSESSERPVGPE